MKDAESPGRIELVKFALRHPLKMLGIAVVAAIGMAVSMQVDWTTAFVKVSTGQTAESHQIAEGIHVR